MTNFDVSLPKPQSDLTRESLKDPYRLDFLGLSREAVEREIKNALVKHVTEFLLELGAGFAFLFRQVLLDVGGDEFFYLSISTARTGALSKAKALGMCAMQDRAYAKRGEQ